MIKKRILTVLLTMPAMIVTALLGWVAGTSIRSPAEAAARTASPEPSPILIAIEERVLTSNIITRGTARFGLPQSVSIVSSVLKSNPGVITSISKKDIKLNEGDIILVASERPVFALQGEIPTHRDLYLGLSGDDVRQLENGLKRMGFDPGPVDGLYDTQTGAAVAAWYTASGWSPYEASPAQLAEMKALEQDLTTAENAKSTADDAVTTASLAVVAARAEVAASRSAAQVAVNEALLVRDELWRDWAPDSERAAADQAYQVAKDALDAADATGVVSIKTAMDALNAVQRDAKVAANQVDSISMDLARIQNQASVQIPADELIFLPMLPVRVNEQLTTLGGSSSGPVMTVTDLRLAIDSSLPLDEAPYVNPGMAVKIDEPDLGIFTTGTVGRVASGPGTDGVDGFHIYLEILVDDPSVSLVGTSVRLSLPIESTGGAVLAVPLSAVTLSADGTSRVQVENNGIFEYVVVEPGLSAAGLVQVTPVDGKLEAGQRVVIGFEQK